eukprot:2645198-Amphidinium_carterae.1
MMPLQLVLQSHIKSETQGFQIERLGPSCMKFVKIKRPSDLWVSQTVLCHCAWLKTSQVRFSVVNKVKKDRFRQWSESMGQSVQSVQSLPL